MQKKLTVIQMAKYLGVSKEAIYNRVRRGTLQSVEEDGIKYVLLTSELEKKPKKTQSSQTSNSEYVEFLKQQLQEYKDKNNKLEEDKERLVKEKEDLLVSTKEKIEMIYKSRDEYIQSILSLINVPTLENREPKQEHIVEIDEIDEEEIDIVDRICDTYEDWISLKEYLSLKDLSKKEENEVIKKVCMMVGKSKHIKKRDDEIFVKKKMKLKKILKK